jgi:hypothetical protein
VTPAAFRKLALSMEGAEEKPHFERTSFRVGTKIFATMTADGSEAMIPVKPLAKCFALLEEEPERFFDYGGWTRRNGSLGIRLAKVDAKRVEPLLREAYERIAPSARRGSPRRSTR